MLIGSFSPLVKIFQPQFHEVLMENPDLVYSEEDQFAPGWQLRIYKPSGDYPLRWRYPKVEQNRVLLEWITGGDDGNMQVETDYTGCVKVPMAVQDTGDLFAMLESGKDGRNMQKTYQQAIKDAKEASEKRVMRAIESTYFNLRQQWKENMENKYEKHLPSVTEYLVLHVKSKQMDRKSKIEREHLKKVEKMMGEIEQQIKPAG
jgi:hypothetical protein